MMRTWLKGSVGLAAAALLFGACSGSTHNETRVTGAPGTYTGPTAPSVSVVAVHTTTATELGSGVYALESLLGSAKEGDLRITMVNAGAKPHQLTVVDLAGQPFDEFQAALRSTGAAATAGKPVVGTIAPVAPGAVGEVTLTLKPGSYALVDLGTDQDGKPYAQGGMVRALNVTPDPSKAAASAS